MFSKISKKKWVNPVPPPSLHKQTSHIQNICKKHESVYPGLITYSAQYPKIAGSKDFSIPPHGNFKLYRATVLWFCRRLNWGSERWSDLPNVTWFILSGARTKTWISCPSVRASKELTLIVVFPRPPNSPREASRHPRVVVLGRLACGHSAVLTGQERGLDALEDVEQSQVGS